MDKLESVQNAIAKFDYVRFSNHNLQGTSVGPIIPQRNVHKYLKNGLDMYEGVMTYDASGTCIPLTNKKAYHYGNMIMRPDLTTLRPIPWLGNGKYKVAEILCESLWRRDSTPHDVCPRYAARKLLQTLDGMGLEFLSGVEVEFSVLKGDTLKPIHGSAINSCTEALSEHSEMLFDVERLLFEAGINVEKILNECYEGVFEFVLPPQLGISGPDTTVTVKQGLLEMAKDKGNKVTFLYQEGTCTNHLNFSLNLKGTNKNLFYHAEAPEFLSSVARQWIAGLLKHSKALKAVMSPTPICYRDFNPLSIDTPSHMYWDIENRSALLRVKNHGPSGTYIENRLPSSLSNPYLALAATLAAGLDGMNQKLDLPPPGLREDTELLPSTLSESLQALEEDKVLTDLLGQELVSSFIKCKRSDLKRFDALKTEEERRLLERELFL